MFESTENPPDGNLSLDLRARAEFLQKMGRAPASRGLALSTEALAALYRLSCSTDNVSEGLKLLHELQTHQIEIDLIQEQREANEREIEAELARYRMLYEFAPAAYLVLGSKGQVLECNRAASLLLNVARSNIEGALLEDYLHPESRFALGWYVKKLAGGSTGERCTVKVGSDAQPVALQLFATMAPSGEVLVLMTQLERGAKAGGS